MVGVDASVSKITHEETPNDPVQDEMWTSSRKGKKARKRSVALRTRDYSEEEICPVPPPASATNFLAVHARVFALGSKYDIPHLQRRSLAKFKAAARVW